MMRQSRRIWPIQGGSIGDWKCCHSVSRWRFAPELPGWNHWASRSGRRLLPL